jgi:hypothetical protein
MVNGDIPASTAHATARIEHIARVGAAGLARQHSGQRSNDEGNQQALTISHGPPPCGRPILLRVDLPVMVLPVMQKPAPAIQLILRQRPQPSFI